MSLSAMSDERLCALVREEWPAVERAHVALLAGEMPRDLARTIEEWGQGRTNYRHGDDSTGARQIWTQRLKHLRDEVNQRWTVRNGLALADIESGIAAATELLKRHPPREA